MTMLHHLIDASYFLAAVLFILGLKQMSSPVTARRGIVWAGLGMLIATFATFAAPELHGLTNYLLMISAIAIGGGFAWISGKKVAMTGMPQMIALYNGMGGGAAAAIAAVELLSAQGKAQAGGLGMGAVLGGDIAALAIAGAFIGCVSFTGSLVAWAKLDGRLHKGALFSGQVWLNALVALAAIACGVLVFAGADASLIYGFFALALGLGFLVAMPIGGADMPVVISLFNALTGLAVGFEGYALGNAAMIIAGIVVGSAGTLLTQLMAKAMNRSIFTVLLGGFGTGGGAASGEAVTGTMREVQAQDAAILMAYAERVLIVPGYGMAVAQAQHKVWELAELLIKRGVKVKFAIHPVAGRMPGHMNVLLAEAGVPYDLIADMDEVNPEFATTTVALVIGANDVVNPVAKTDKSSPLYGMPILDAVSAEHVIVIKRGKGTGFSGVENHLFYCENTQMLYGDATKAAAELITTIKTL
ncbi:MAG: NAD(P)(+) transhydrogenase (Re/Si-specific) subunit beta [Gammaproteobacteria bacterium]|nr:NAD(P)(+) transhydrogenase (Re/Si-specific) subunit beta [Gammaproteobacteria bacterium]